MINMWVEESANYFRFQIEDGYQGRLSDYSVYRNIHKSRWPNYHDFATSAFNKYAECLALNMSILPKALALEEMVIVDLCRGLLSDVSMNFSRAMNFSEYVVVPEECEGTEAEFMENLIEEHEKSIEHKACVDKLSSDLFNKSLRSGELIEALLQHRGKG